MIERQLALSEIKQTLRQIPFVPSSVRVSAAKRRWHASPPKQSQRITSTWKPPWAEPVWRMPN